MIIKNKKLFSANTNLMKCLSLFLSILSLTSPLTPSCISSSSSGFLVSENMLSSASIESSGENFKEDISIVVEIGEDEIRITPDHNEGYNPSIYIAPFLSNGLSQILYGVESGGSGGYSFFEMYSLKNGKEQKIFDSSDFNPSISASYQGDLVEIDYQGKLLYLDASSSACKEREDCSLTISSINVILPYYNIALSQEYLMILQKVYAGFTANNLGYITSLVEITEDGYKIISVGTTSNFNY